mmetsp:Transcript_12237/g.29048  ORF Transcript_12237/g.29048 Transcript_12237/m.29048 type:complete len:376 (-) Transcript_12237:358-1485(-)
MRLSCGIKGSQSWILLSVLSATRLSGKNTAQGFLSSKKSFASIGVIATGNRPTATSKRMALPPELIDVDCNLLHGDLKTLQKTTDTSFSPWNMLNEDAVKNANIAGMISPSSTMEESERGIELLSTNPPPLAIKTTVGIHPYHVRDESLLATPVEEHVNRLKGLLAANRSVCAAVGECGLDASEGFPPLEDQIPWFRRQIEIAQELGLPLFVHERLAFDTAMELLKCVDPARTPVIIHCFTGTQAECSSYIERGYFISVSGYILKPSNDNCAQVVSCLEEGVIPLDKLMIETDAPYMGFEGCRQLYLEFNQSYVASLNSKKRKRLQQSIYPNVPSSLPMVLSKVTECLQKNDPTLTRDKVAKATTANARTFFGLP